MEGLLLDLADLELGFYVSWGGELLALDHRGLPVPDRRPQVIGEQLKHIFDPEPPKGPPTKLLVLAPHIFAILIGGSAIANKIEVQEDELAKEGDQPQGQDKEGYAEGVAGHPGGERQGGVGHHRDRGVGGHGQVQEQAVYEQQEGAVVALPHAGADPGAVVVEVLHADVAGGAVRGPRRPVQAAGPAEFDPQEVRVYDLSADVVCVVVLLAVLQRDAGGVPVILMPRQYLPMEPRIHNPQKPQGHGSNRIQPQSDCHHQLVKQAQAVQMQAEVEPAEQVDCRGGGQIVFGLG